MKEIKIVCISDTHEELLDEEEMPEGDVLVHGGDFTYVGSIQKVQQFNAWLRRIKHKYPLGIVVIAGNHDKTFDPDHRLGQPELVVPMLDQCTYLADSGIEINGFKFWGSPVSPTFGREWAFNRDRMGGTKRHWDLIPEGTDVLITHSPPLNILDGVPRKVWDSKGNKAMELMEHVGCYDLMETVKRIKPKLHVFGHIHEGYGSLEKDGTWFVNPSIMNEHYYPNNKPIIITIKKDA